MLYETAEFNGNDTVEFDLSWCSICERMKQVRQLLTEKYTSIVDMYKTSIHLKQHQKFTRTLVNKILF